MALLTAAATAIGTAASAGAGAVAGAASSLGGLSGLGTLVSIGGTIFSGLSAMSQAEYQASMMEQQAGIARINAANAQDSAQKDQQDNDAKTTALLGQQEAIQGASGLAVTGKSAGLTRKSAAELGRRDALNIRHEGDLQSWNYMAQAAGDDASAGLYKQSGTNSLLSSFFDAAGTLVNSANRVRNPNRFTGSGNGLASYGGYQTQRASP